jgi:4-hydroxybenzoate polyprenyltransferase
VLAGLLLSGVFAVATSLTGGSRWLLALAFPCSTVIVGLVGLYLLVQAAELDQRERERAVDATATPE